jgi:hypothetical protein
MIDRVLVLSASGAVLLAAVLALQLQAGDAETLPAAATAPPPAATGPATVPIRSPRVDELVETTLGRPLFAATRRPPERAKSDQAADPGLSNVRLTGVIIEADRRLAIFAVPDAKPLVRSEGDAVNDWHLDSISLREVALSGPGGLMTLEPKSDPALVRPARAPRPAVNPAPPGAPSGRPPPSTAAAAPQPKAPPAAAAPPRAANGPRSR